ncbi:hypothetical protein [Streptomyces sp. NPDC020965]|uniref:hypothetical protein n=1 Tax=Streptomyces sp. NPDC020965 TaxID=3365105 RepID=UPI00378A574F
MSNPSGGQSEIQSESSSDDGPLISQHAAIVFLFAVVLGLVFGGLARAAGKPWPEAVMTGLAAAGVTVVAHRLIARS